MSQIKFYKGNKANYHFDTTLSGSELTSQDYFGSIYFAEDTNEILVNGVSYGGGGSTGSFLSNVNAVFYDGTTGQVVYIEQTGKDTLGQNDVAYSGQISGISASDNGKYISIEDTYHKISVLPPASGNDNTESFGLVNNFTIYDILQRLSFLEAYNVTGGAGITVTEKYTQAVYTAEEYTAMKLLVQGADDDDFYETVDSEGNTIYVRRTNTWEISSNLSAVIDASDQESILSTNSSNKITAKLSADGPTHATTYDQYALKSGNKTVATFNVAGSAIDGNTIKKDANGALSVNIKLKKFTTDNSVAAQYKLVDGSNNVISGSDTIDIPKDQFLKSATIVDYKDGDVEATTPADLTDYTNVGTEQEPVYVLTSKLGKFLRLEFILTESVEDPDTKAKPVQYVDLIDILSAATSGVSSVTKHDYTSDSAGSVKYDSIDVTTDGVTNNIQFLFESLKDDATVMQGQVGDLKGLTVAQLKALSFSQLFERMFFPVLEATRTNTNSLSISNPSSTLVEVGTSALKTNTALTSTFTSESWKYNMQTGETTSHDVVFTMYKLEEYYNVWAGISNSHPRFDVEEVDDKLTYTTVNASISSDKGDTASYATPPTKLASSTNAPTRFMYPGTYSYCSFAKYLANDTANTTYNKYGYKENSDGSSHVNANATGAMYSAVKTITANFKYYVNGAISVNDKSWKTTASKQGTAAQLASINVGGSVPVVTKSSATGILVAPSTTTLYVSYASTLVNSYKPCIALPANMAVTGVHQWNDATDVGYVTTGETVSAANTAANSIYITDANNNNVPYRVWSWGSPVGLTNYKIDIAFV